MKRTKTPSFVLDLPLIVESWKEPEILKRLDVGRQMYNACLGESDRRYFLMKQSKEYQHALAMPKGEPKSPKQVARTAAFREVCNRFEFNEFALEAYVKTIHSSWLGEHITSHISQKIARRAFKAVQKKAFGTAHRVRFKGKNQFDSLEGKINKQELIFRNGVLKWGTLELRAIIDPKNEYQEYGLNHKIKFCRLVRRKINDKNRFFVQLILEGKPYQNPKHPVGTEQIGLDLGPSTIAYVGDSRAELKQFCEEIVPDWKGTRRLQRKMDRSRRATNPGNYNPDGTIPKRKKGEKRVWRKSKRYQKLQQQYAEQNRRLAEHRKSLHGKMANEIISLGCNIKTEKISYRAWQKMFGKSITIRAPSMMVSLIQRKAENARGRLLEIPTKTTALSQTCHVSRERVKKPMNQRWHIFPDGTKVQRDLYSAFLVGCCVVDKEGKYSLDIAEAEKLWPGAEPLLNDAMSRVELRYSQSATCRNPVPASFGLQRSKSGSYHKPVKAITEIAEVYPNVGESCEKVIATTGITRL